MKARILAVGSLTSDLFSQTTAIRRFSKENLDFIGFCLGDKVRIEERYDTYGGEDVTLLLG